LEYVMDIALYGFEGALIHYPHLAYAADLSGGRITNPILQRQLEGIEIPEALVMTEFPDEMTRLELVLANAQYKADRERQAFAAADSARSAAAGRASGEMKKVLVVCTSDEMKYIEDGVREAYPEAYVTACITTQAVRNVLEGDPKAPDLVLVSAKFEKENAQNFIGGYINPSSRGTHIPCIIVTGPVGFGFAREQARQFESLKASGRVHGRISRRAIAKQLKPTVEGIFKDRQLRSARGPSTEATASSAAAGAVQVPGAAAAAPLVSP